MESDAWRSWSNISPFLIRHGLLLEDPHARGPTAALAIVQASLSATGYQTARDVMRLNETIGEITGDWDEYGEWLYWLSIFGTPSADEPWGWQIDGHHLIINCFVLGDQVVMTPVHGLRAVVADTGKYAGTRVFDRGGARAGADASRSRREQQQATLYRRSRKACRRSERS